MVSGSGWGWTPSAFGTSPCKGEERGLGAGPCEGEERGMCVGLGKGEERGMCAGPCNIHQRRHSCAERGNLDRFGSADVLPRPGARRPSRIWLGFQRDTRVGARV